MAGETKKVTDIIINNVPVTTLKQFDKALEQQGWGFRKRAEAIRYFIHAVATGLFHYKPPEITTTDKK